MLFAVFIRSGFIEMNTQQSCLFPPPSLHGSLRSRLPTFIRSGFIEMNSQQAVCSLRPRSTARYARDCRRL